MSGKGFHGRQSAPRALRADTEIGRLLRAIDVPEECDGLGGGCPLRPLPTAQEAGVESVEEALAGLDPCARLLAAVFGQMEDPVRRKGCRHCRQAGRDFPEGLGIDGWAELLAGFDPEDHAPRPLPEPHMVATQAARVDVYDARESAGQELFHPADFRPGEDEGVSILGGARRRQGGIEGAGGEEAEAASAPCELRGWVAKQHEKKQQMLARVRAARAKDALERRKARGG